MYTNFINITLLMVGKQCVELKDIQMDK